MAAPRTRQVEDNLWNEVAKLELGLISLARNRYAASERRQADLSIGNFDADTRWLCLVLQGSIRLRQGDRCTALQPNTMGLCDGSDPVELQVGPPIEPAGDDSRLVEWIGIRIPRRLLPLTKEESEGLIGIPVSADDGARRVLRVFLLALMDSPAALESSTRWSLAGTVADLIRTSMVECVQRASPTKLSEDNKTALCRLQTFIEENLDLVDLTPTYIARKHHISVRQLHKTFRQSEMTVAAWIRFRRLENWRRDLVDPGTASVGVHALAKRWGIHNAAHACRIFADAYGVSPSVYRSQRAR